jgi:large subunit ribosomal protein L4
MELNTRDTQETLSVNDAIFNCEYNEGLVHQAVVRYMNGGRSGNSAQKTRAEVRGGGRKPWNQKGTGRARAGTIRSPIWRSGGVTFASKKRDYTQKINKKMYKGAIRSILAQLQRSGNLVVVSDFQCPTLKTKDFVAKMRELELSNALIIMHEVGENEYLASRNVYDYGLTDAASIDPVNLLRYERVLITTEAIKMLEEQFK